MARNREAVLTSGAIPTTLFRLAGPMSIGLFAQISFTLVDTLFVARLGTDALAALGFAFPVVFVISNITNGLGTATSAVVSQAIGRGDQHLVRRYTTDSLILSFLIVVVLSIGGYLTIDPLFTALGARGETLHLVRQYMAITYLGTAFIVIPTISINAIRATGDTVTPSTIMVVAALVNVVLDPIMIYGWFGFPRMEMVGAALATVIGRIMSCIAALVFLHFRERMISFRRPRMNEVLRSWRSILAIGVPASATNIMVPLSNLFVTAIAARAGKEVVAALGAGMRVTAFTSIPVYALSASLVPFVGQNWGARRYRRARHSKRHSIQFGTVWGGLCFVGLWVTAPLIAGIFSQDAQVRREIVLYLRIVPLGHALQNSFIFMTSILNAIQRAMVSTILMAVRMFVLYVPLSVLGAWWWGGAGLFGGMAAANTLSGIMATVVSGYLVRKPRRHAGQAALLAAQTGIPLE
jgi:putative MATE family efflux protein